MSSFSTDAAQGSVGRTRGAGQRAEIGAIFARIEEDRAAILDVGVELGESGRRGLRRVGEHRPVDQRKEDDLVPLDIDARRDRPARPRCAGASMVPRPCKSGEARIVDFGIAGQT